MPQTTHTQTQSMPASSAEIGEALRVLFNALPFQRGTDPATVVAAYVEALRGASLDGIKAGISKFLRGECDDVSPRFVPTPPELARIVRTAVIVGRIPVERQIARAPEAPGERGRMKLKMSLWAAAFGSPRMDEVERANREGFEAMIALAQAWGVHIHDETWAAFEEPNPEREWQTARNRAWADIHRSPPPFLRRWQQHHQFENAA